MTVLAWYHGHLFVLPTLSADLCTFSIFEGTVLER